MSPFADVNIIDRPWEECQGEYLEKVRQLKAGGNDAFKAGRIGEAITWWTKGLQFIQQASLVQCPRKDWREEACALLTALVSNTGKGYFLEKKYSPAYSQFQLVKKLDKTSQMPYYKAAKCVKFLCEEGSRPIDWQNVYEELAAGLDLAKKAKSK